MDPTHDDVAVEAVGSASADETPTRPAESEVERLRRQVAELTAERDFYLRVYMAERAKTRPAVTQADLDAAVPFRPWFDEMTRELGIK